MQLGRVIGTVVASQRASTVEGWSLRVVEKINVQNQLTGSYVVAVDAVGVGVDEIVMYTTGSAARQTDLTASRPCDAIIMAVVDTWEVEGDVKYIKDRPLEEYG